MADNETPKEVSGFEQVFPALGTLVRLKAYHHDEQLVAKAFGAVESEVQRLEQILSDYNPNSETRKLTNSALHHPTSVSDELWAVLQASERWHQLSNGTFDSSLGALTRLWRKYRRVKRVPAPADVQEAFEHCGWSHVKLLEGQRIEFLEEQIYLDFGAIGKGYIVDKAFTTLAEHGLKSVLIDISGNMRCGDPPPSRPGWLVAVSALEKGGKPLRIISLSNKAIATSGDLWQYQVIEGVRRSHILDPRTGWGVEGPIAATVVCDSAINADAAATVGCIASTEFSQRIVDSLGGEILVASRDASGELNELSSAGFPKSTAEPSKEPE